MSKFLGPNLRFHGTYWGKVFSLLREAGVTFFTFPHAFCTINICLCRRGPTAQFIFWQAGGYSLLAVCGPDSQHLHCQLGRLSDSREDGLDRGGRTSKPRGNDQRARHQLYGGATSPGFIFVQHLRGFSVDF